MLHLLSLKHKHLTLMNLNYLGACNNIVLNIGVPHVWLLQGVSESSPTVIDVTTSVKVSEI
jgi:hypothetical protein